ncbi:MAG: hypothetical protein JXJ17_12600 [Anaerolineae bacterium]|nr:hypothetical protein [Anaerolineae bacterium]
MKKENRKQLIISLALYAGFTLTFLAANILSNAAEKGINPELNESIAGMLLGFLAFPVFCIGLPLYLARRWELEFSFWPRGKKWPLVLGVIVLYAVLTQYQPVTAVIQMRIPLRDFLLHFISTTLFHVSYYPLFAVLMLPVIRKDYGVAAGVLIPALLFALYHLAGFYYFPAGLTLRMQVLLFASYTASMLFYLWSESAILVALNHTIGGAVGLAINGSLFNQVDELLIVTAVIMTGLFAYMIVYTIRHNDRPYNRGFWLQTGIDRGPST